MRTTLLLTALFFGAFVMLFTPTMNVASAGLTKGGLVGGPGGCTDNCTFTNPTATGDQLTIDDGTYLVFGDPFVSSTYLNQTFQGGLALSADEKVVLSPNAGQPGGQVDVNGKLVVSEGVNFGDGASRPTCAVGLRGTVWFEAVGGASPDTLAVCRRDGAGVYAWVSLF